MNKVKFLFLIISISFILPSCQSQKMDVAQLQLPAKSTALKILGLRSIGTGIGTEDTQYVTYAPDNEQLTVNFAGTTIESDNNSDFFTPGIIRFYGKNKGNYEGYTLHIDNPASFQKVLDYFLKMKDQFKLVFDNGKAPEERARVFNSEQNKTIYLVLARKDSKGKQVGQIDAISMNEVPLLSSRLGGAFGYYKEYLEYRKHKAAGFSYQDFLKEIDNEIYNAGNNLK